MSRGRRFARNVAWSLAGQAGIMGINFFSIPYLLRKFGLEAYGVYQLLFVAGNYVGLFHFGAGLATIKFVSEARASGEGDSLRDALRHSALIHFLGVGASAAALWFGARALTVLVFDVPAYYRGHALWLLRAAAVGGVFAAGAQWVSAAFQGLQRFGWPTAAALLQAALMPLGLVAVLALGRGLGAVGVWYVIVQLLVFALGAAILRVSLREFSSRGGRLSFGRFARYGASFWPAALSGVASTQIDRVFVAGQLGMADLTFYNVPSGVLQRLQIVPQTVSHALMPVLSESGRTEGREELARLYLRSARALFALSLPALGIAVILLPQFLGLWLSPSFSSRASTAARLLAATQAFALAFHAPYALAGGMGGGRYSSSCAWGQAILSLVFWAVLIPRYGIIGAAGGALLAQAISASIYMHLVHSRLLGLSWARFIREAVSPLAVPIAAMLAAAFFWRGLSWTWLGFFGVVAAALAVYAVLLWRFLPGEDREAAARWLARRRD